MGFVTRQILVVFLVFAHLQAHCALASLEGLRQYQRRCFDDVIPCVMFMDENEAYGCAQCGDDMRTEVVREFTQVEELTNFISTGTDRRVVMIPEYVFADTKALFSLRDATNVVSVIVYEKDTDANNDPLKFPPIQGGSFSTDLSDPNFRYNYYPSTPPVDDGSEAGPGVTRNKVGTGGKFLLFRFNIFRVNEKTAEEIRQKITRFPERKKEGLATSTGEKINRSAMSAVYKIRSLGQMYACPSAPAATPDTASDADPDLPDALSEMNSKTCLEDRTCLPVGGQSLWSALERVDPEMDREYLAITAPIDSLAFFPDLALGASAEIASLAVLMAIAESVSRYRRDGKGKGLPFRRQPVYFAWNAQSWGYTGSARFLKDLNDFECTDPNSASEPTFQKGCNVPFMDSLKFQDFKGASFSVLNIGQLTAPDLAGTKPPFDFFKQSGPQEGSTREIEDALDEAFAEHDPGNLLDGERITPIDASQSFRRYMPEANVISVSNYNEEFGNSLYHSMYDSNILITERERTSLHSAADAIANAVISLVFGENVGKVKTDKDIIDGVLTCLTSGNGWKECKLAEEYRGELYNEKMDDVIAGNYPGSFFPSTRLADTNPSGAAKLAFIRSFFAYHNRYDVEEEEVECRARLEDEENCRGFMEEINKRAGTSSHSQLRTAICTKGRCVASDTYTHNAYGAALKSTNDMQSSFQYDDESPSCVDFEPGATPCEAAWTESVWDRTLGVCGYVEDTVLFGGVILGVGVFVLVFSVVFSIWLERVLFREKSLETTEISIAASASNPQWAVDAEQPV